MFYNMRIFVSILAISIIQASPILNAVEMNFDTSFIVGGSDAIVGEFPYQLSLQSTNRQPPYPFCGACILNEKYAITAAHCVYANGDKIKIKVIAGELHLQEFEGTEQVRNVKRIIVHDYFDSFTALNDIALLEIEEPFEFNEFVAPIRLPQEGQKIVSSCVVSGWGVTEYGGSTPDLLQKVTVPVITDDKCREYYGVQFIADSMICAGPEEGGMDACQRDSGGPMVCNGYLGGIVSWGLGCAEPNHPGVYTELSYYIDWIKNITQY